MGQIFEQLDLPTSAPLNPKTVTNDRTALPALQVYQGLTLYDTSAPAGVYVYTGADATNQADSWDRVDGGTGGGGTGDFVDSGQTPAVDLTYISGMTLAEAQTVGVDPDTIFEVDVVDGTDTVPIGSGGTGASTAPQALTNLGAQPLISSTSQISYTDDISDIPLLFPPTPILHTGVTDFDMAVTDLIDARGTTVEFTTEALFIAGTVGVQWHQGDIAIVDNRTYLYTGTDDATVVTLAVDFTEVTTVIANQNGADADEPARFRLWSGTQAEYEALTPDADTFYNVTDDATPAGLAGVTIATDQTITGAKTFDQDLRIGTDQIFAGADISHPLAYVDQTGTSYVTLAGVLGTTEDLVTQLGITVGTNPSTLRIYESGIASNAGIAFNQVTNTIPAPANVLDFYEEATWTPTLQNSFVPTVSGTLPTIKFATYARTGNQVIIHCAIDIPLNTTTTTASIGGLPFSPSFITGVTLFNGSYINFGDDTVTGICAAQTGNSGILFYDPNHVILTWEDIAIPAFVLRTLQFQITYETND